MNNYKVGCDAHKRYSQFSVIDQKARICQRTRIDHRPGAIEEFLSQFQTGTPVAIESVGNWYWIVEAIEAAGCQPLLTNAAKAKVMMGNVNKTDKLDADGLALLLHNGTLPTVWIPEGELRDERELPRTRMALSRIRTGIKNRIHATLAKYAIDLDEASDSFSGKGLAHLKQTLARLPEETRRCVEQELELLEELQKHIEQFEERIRRLSRQTPNMQLLKTLPGVGDILAILIEREVGSVDRFPDGEHFASYAGVVPKVKSSGGKTYHGHMRQEANQYLKWAFIEAASVVSRFHNTPSWRNKHVVRLYERVRRRKGHGIAIGAVARHLAESAYWMLRKGQTYHEPSQLKKGLPKQG